MLISNLETSIDVKELHSKNNPDKFIALSVLKFDKSNFINEVQLKNIEFILVTELVSNPVISISSISVKNPNIFCISLTLLVSKFFKFKLIKLLS